MKVVKVIEDYSFCEDTYLLAFFWCVKARFLSLRLSKSVKHNDFRSDMVAVFEGISDSDPRSKRVLTIKNKLLNILIYIYWLYLAYET